MFRIADGRETFYQWDLDRQIIVEDESIVEVHFCNRTDDCSLVVEVKDGLAAVPNAILQRSFDVRVFGYDGKATRYDEVFSVKARSKPSDYVYTETEIKRYEDLSKRIEEIEKNGVSEETINNAVNEYLDKNPINMDGYATEEFVEEYVAEELKNAEVIVDLTGYATEAYVDEAISNIKIEIPEGSDIDLTGYATEKWVKDQGYLTEQPDLSAYATRTELNNVSNSIPTKVSQLSNDKNYLTKHQDISHLATVGQVQTVESKIPTKTSQLTNDSGYLTEHIDISGKADKDHVHLSYALKTEVPTKVSQLQNDSNFITRVPDEYITETELNNKGYATEEYVDTKVDNYFIDKPLNNLLNVSDATVERAAKEAEIKFIETAIAQPELPICLVYRGDTIPGLLHSLGGNLWEVYPCVNADHMTQKRGNYNTFTIFFSKTSGSWTIRTSTYNTILATTAYVDNAINNLDIPEGATVDLTNYYTKEETDAAIYTSKDIYYIDMQDTPQGYANAIPATQDMTEFATRYFANENVCIYIRDWNANSSGGWYPVSIGGTETQIIMSRVTIDSSRVKNGYSTNYFSYRLIKQPDGWLQYKEFEGNFTVTTKEYVDEAIANIEIPEGGGSADLTNYYTKDEVNALFEGIATAEGGSY